MNKSLATFTASLILFGSNGIVASQIGLPSYDIVVLRTFLGAALLGALLLISRKRTRISASPKSLAFVAISGAFLGISWLLLFEAYSLVGVGTSSLLYYCGPVLVMALSPILFKERLTHTRIAGFAIVLVGVMLVNGGTLQGGLSPQGLTYGAVAALCLAAMIVFNKKAEGIGGLESAFVQIGSAFFTALVGTAALHGLSIDVQPADWPAILMLGFVNTGLGCYLYFGSMGKLKAQTVAVCGYIEPVCAVVMAMAFLGEGMSALQALGALLVIAGAAATELAPLITKAFVSRHEKTRISPSLAQ
jgi:drug/metabolite transporter (DMT)-like permease